MIKLKLNIKNAQLAQAVGSPASPVEESKPTVKKAAKTAARPKKTAAKAAAPEVTETVSTEVPARRIRAKSRSAFEASTEAVEPIALTEEESLSPEAPAAPIASEEEAVPLIISEYEEELPPAEEEPPLLQTPPAQEPVVPEAPVAETLPEPAPEQAPAEPVSKIRLGPTGRHVRDLLTTPKAAPAKPAVAPKKTEPVRPKSINEKPSARPVVDPNKLAEEEDLTRKKGKLKDFQDVKPLLRREERWRASDARRLTEGGDEEQVRWRKRRGPKFTPLMEKEPVIRPTQLKVRLPIIVKDLAAELKLKASEIIAKMFMSGLVLTLNDSLTDPTVVQLIGSEFGCEIAIDSSEEERMRVTDKSIREEIAATAEEQLQPRAPVVAFMGHVDHGKTSLIDWIRKSNRVASEAGAITQHIGAFRCHTPVGEITILDTPGHEAFTAMRARGAEVTDIVVLVIAGDEGMREQTVEAMKHAKAAGVTIVVALNKCDKRDFNAENVYRQLAEHDLLPESWGGTTLTVNCSAITGEGIPQLLETLALQSEMLELRADPSSRARGTVLESEMHRGLGSVATVLIQNGTLRQGDAIVFGNAWGSIKTIRSDQGKALQEAGPSYPVLITGLNTMPEAGDEFVVVKSEQEARTIAEKRLEAHKARAILAVKRPSLESLFQQDKRTGKKILNVILRADMQGSLEALKASFAKIQSEKVILNIIYTGVGQISESDIQLAIASKAVIFGFHTEVESHATPIIKQHGVIVRIHDIIYHAVDDVTALMAGTLEKLAQENEVGLAEVRATFKASQLGVIAGCFINEGAFNRTNLVEVLRDGKSLWKGKIASLRRDKDDVREVKKGFECGVLLDGFNAVEKGDTLRALEITYVEQQL